MRKFIDIVEKVSSPDVFYHGTPQTFDGFDMGKARRGSFGRGFYFSSCLRDAECFGERIIVAKLDLKNPYVTKGLAFEPSENSVFHGNTKEKLETLGYDSVIYDQGDCLEVVVFNVKQIHIVDDFNSNYLNADTYLEK